ncbi:MAG: PAS domain S-box protein [Anaerolineae bacterium]|nr:PAS domain S-box protein [Anaerolineae bacterium]
MTLEALKPLNVLHIEDSEDDALLIKRILKQGGYAVTTRRVDTATGLRDALKSHTWDIIISDFSMPNFNGTQALQIIRESGSDLPFIVVSGAIGEEMAVAVMKAGANDYVMKDNLQRLVPAIERELRDVDERRALKRAQDEVNKLSRALMQSTNMVLIINRDGIVDYANDSFFRTTGYDPSEIIGQSGFIVQPHSLSDTDIQSIITVLQMVGEWRGEVPNIGKADRPRIWTSVTVSPIRNNEGEIIHFLVVMEDITARKELEAELQRYTEQLEVIVEERTRELRQAKENLEVILNNSSDAILLAESSGDVLKVNPAFKTVFGDRVDRAIENLLSVLPETDEMITLSNALLSVIFDGSSKRVEAKVQRHDGAIIDADVALAPVINEGDNRAGVVMSLRDITHLKDIERFKTRFVANAAHDLSNPIAILKLRLFLLRRNPELFEEHVETLSGQIQRLEHLVEDLRTLSQIDRGLIELDLEETDLNSLIRTVVNAHVPLAESKGLRLVFQPDLALPALTLDKRRFERVIVNLVANALNYTPSGGEVTVLTDVDGDEVLFSVRDTGIGIPADDLPHVFERFYRSKRAKHHDMGGTGLGLAIVKEMIDAHGANIEVRSRVNEGTVFTVRMRKREETH